MSEVNEPAAAPDRDRYSLDIPVSLKRPLIFFGVGVGTFLLFRLMSLFPGAVEAVYATRVGPFITRSLSLVTGIVPVSLVEVTLFAYLAWLGNLAVRAMIVLRTRQRSVRNALAHGGLRLMRDTGIVITLFYLLWGFNYARAPLSDRLEWPEWSEPDRETLIQLVRDVVSAGNSAYREIHGSDDAGIPTPMPEDLSELDGALEQGWRQAASILPLPASAQRRYGRAKRLLLTPVVARFGISGFFFPWTGEANVLWNSPAVTRIQSMAHEKAHQRGIGPEAEASFLGFLAGINAPDAHARYSAYVLAQGQLLAVLARVDREVASEIASNRVPGIRRDLEDLSAYWARFRGIGTTVGRAVNDRYLRANRVQGGVASYGRAVRLLITFAQSGGRLD